MKKKNPFYSGLLRRNVDISFETNFSAPISKRNLSDHSRDICKDFHLKKEELAMDKPIRLTPERIFGLRCDVEGNVHFKTDQEIVYPAAGVLVIQDCVSKRQKFLR